MSNWYPSAEGIQTGLADAAARGRIRLAINVRTDAGSIVNDLQGNKSGD
jgi:hypothetical protein